MLAACENERPAFRWMLYGIAVIAVIYGLSALWKWAR
jgi:hypothetical protein